MPETRTFDTHAAVKVLTDAGAEPELAEAFVAGARDAGTHDDTVTSDRLDAALANLRVEIGRDLATLTWRIIGAGIAIAGLAVAVLRLPRLRWRGSGERGPDRQELGGPRPLRFFAEPVAELTHRTAREGSESVQPAQLGKMFVPGLGPHRVVGEFVPVQVERSTLSPTAGMAVSFEGGKTERRRSGSSASSRGEE